jgi:hypothetical protein
VAMTDHQAVLKNVPALKIPATAAAATNTGPQTLQGQWKNVSGKYQLSLSGTELLASVDGDRMTVAGEGMGLVFARED